MEIKPTSMAISIGFDAKRYFSNSTGLGNYSRWLINGISINEKLKITLFTTKLPENESQFRVIVPSFVWRYLKSIWRIRGINADLLTNDIQIYHGLSNELPFGIHKTGIKTVVTIHDCINLRYPENYSSIDRFIYKYKLNYAQKYADAIVVPSLQTKQDLINYFKTTEAKIQIIPLSVPKKPLFTLEKKEPFILCVSSFDKRKNIKNLVLAYLAIESPAYPLLIAGKMGKEFVGIQKLIGTRTDILLLPNPSTEQIHNLYHNSIYCIYPSVFEGFGIPILEAFLHEKAVATSNCSSMPEVGGDAALYFDPLDIDDMKDAMVSLFDENVRNKLESKARNQLLKFDSDKLISQYFSLYSVL